MPRVQSTQSSPARTIRSPLPFLLGVLLLLSPSVSFITYHGTQPPKQQQQQQQHLPRSEARNSRRIPWAAAALSPGSDAVAAAAAAATLRKNVISGAAIFTVGDILAQILFPKQSKELLPPETKPMALPGSTSTSTSNATPKPNPNPLSVVAGTDTGKHETAAKQKDASSRAVSVRDSRRSLSRRVGPGAPRWLQTAMTTSLDRNRLCSAMVLGAIWSGFCVPLVYGAVESRFPGKASLKQVLTKVLVTCSILSTVGNYATMFARRFASECLFHQFDPEASLRFRWFSRPVRSLKLLAATTRGCARTCNHDIGEVIADDLKIWPLYDLTCYGLIPPSWRPVTTSLMSSGWAMYMSAVSAREASEEDDEEDETTRTTATATATTKKDHQVRSTVDTWTLEGRPLALDGTTATATTKAPTTTTGTTTQRLLKVAGGTVSAANATATATATTTTATATATATESVATAAAESETESETESGSETESAM